MKAARTFTAAAVLALAGIFAFAGCEVGDASVHLTWTINGQPATGDSCDAVDGQWVSVLEDENENGTWEIGEWRSARRLCSQGSMETVKHFFSGDAYRIAFQLQDSDDNVLSISQWQSHTFEEGTNSFTVDFQTGTTEGASVQFAWYIHGILGGEDIGWGYGSEALEDNSCEWVSTMLEISGMPEVQLWLETSGDNEADDFISFTCTDGQATTDELWEAGDELKYAFALVSSEGTLLSQSWDWETATLTSGVNDFQDVNFYVGDYGPLEVTIEWADKVDDPAFTTCANLEPYEVNIMGYLLCWADDCAGWVYDEVDIDGDPADCQDELAWDIIDFAEFILTIDAEDSAGTTVWGAECQDIIVDEVEPGSNGFTCQVLMTESPG